MDLNENAIDQLQIERYDGSIIDRSDLLVSAKGAAGGDPGSSKVGVGMVNGVGDKVNGPIDENKLAAACVVAVKGLVFRSTDVGAVKLVTRCSQMQMGTVVVRTGIGAKRTASGRDIAQNILPI